VRLKGSGITSGVNQIRYRWTVTGGHINGTGQDVIWDFKGTPPGRYRATLSIEFGGDCQHKCAASASTEVLLRGCPTRPLVSCPSVSICCPAGATIGQPVTFTVSNTSGGTPGFRHAYHWNISAGRIISGQGTYSIQVETAGLDEQMLDASFEAVGYGPKCNTSCLTRLHHPYPSTLRGRVNIGMDGQPIRGAHVTILANDRTTALNTNERGYFELSGLPPGQYKIEATAQDFSSQIQTIELASAASREVNFFLRSAPRPQPAPPTPTPQPSPSIRERSSPSPSPSPSPEATPTVTASHATVLPSPATVKSSGPPTNYLPYIVFIIFCILAALGSAIMMNNKKKILLGVPADDDDGAVLTDEVTCTVFAPSEAPPGDCFLVQAFAHLAEQAPLLAEKAMESDEAAKQRGSKKLETRIERGKEMVFCLNMPGLSVDETSQALIWDGEIDSVQFAVTIPETCKSGNLIGTLTVCYESVPIGHVKFKFKVTGAPQPQLAAQPQAVQPQQQVLEATCISAPLPSEQNFVRYKQAFISYASQDRPEVLKRVQMLKMADIKFFHDLLTLEPGDQWEETIYQYIDQSDVIFLFWSSAAKQSAWVEKEVRYALSRKGGKDEAAPEILPVIIEGPPVVPPPDDLKMLHFNDTFMYFIKAEEATRQGAADA
jgi:hypothetical protein